jgi:hypothetical protein
MTVYTKLFTPSVSAGDQEGDLHHQRHRVGEYEPAQDHQEPGLVPKR